MTVAELIAKLQTMPQDLPVHINDVGRGNYFETIDGVWHVEADEEINEASVDIAVNFE